MVADKAEPAGIVALSAFARAMDATGTRGIVRLVARCDCMKMWFSQNVRHGHHRGIVHTGLDSVPCCGWQYPY